MYELAKLDHPKSPHRVISEENLNEIDFFFNKIKKREYFSFVRACCGVWYRLQKNGIDKMLLVDNSPKGIRKLAQRYAEIITAEKHVRWKMDIKPPLEFFQLLQKAHKIKGLYVGFADSVLNETQHLPRTAGIELLYRRFVTKNYKLYNAILWRNIVVSMRFFEFIDLIRDMNVIMVTPSYEKETKGQFNMKNIGELLKIPKFYHIDISYSSAAYDVDRIEKEMIELSKLEGDKCFIMQGGFVANQLIARLHNKIDKSFMFNWGRALNILDNNKFFNEGWKKVHYNYIIKWYANELKKL